MNIDYVKLLDENGYMFRFIEYDIESMIDASKAPILAKDCEFTENEYFVLSNIAVDYLTKQWKIVLEPKLNEKNFNEYRDILVNGFKSGENISLLGDLNCNFLHLLLRTTTNHLNALVKISEKIFNINKKKLGEKNTLKSLVPFFKSKNVNQQLTGPLCKIVINNIVKIGKNAHDLWIQCSNFAAAKTDFLIIMWIWLGYSIGNMISRIVQTDECYTFDEGERLIQWGRQVFRTWCDNLGSTITPYTFRLMVIAPVSLYDFKSKYPSHR